MTTNANIVHAIEFVQGHIMISKGTISDLITDKEQILEVSLEAIEARVKGSRFSKFGEEDVSE